MKKKQHEPSFTVACFGSMKTTMVATLLPTGGEALLSNQVFTSPSQVNVGISQTIVNINSSVRDFELFRESPIEVTYHRKEITE